MSTKVLGGIGILGAGAGAYYMFGKEKTIPKIIISGGPASGKGTQCELIVDKCEAARSARACARRLALSFETRPTPRAPPLQPSLLVRYGCKHISTGDALRHHVKMQTDLGKEAKVCASSSSRCASRRALAGRR